MIVGDQQMMQVCLAHVRVAQVLGAPIGVYGILGPIGAQGPLTGM
jgi:hypothetical protein